MRDRRKLWVGKVFSLAVVWNIVAVYAALCVASLIMAQFISVLEPDSVWSSRLTDPIQHVLEFVDLHWKVTILIVAPFIVPNIRELLGRVSKVSIGSAAIEVTPAGIHQKPIEADEKVGP
jgi:hypothetical protein